MGCISRGFMPHRPYQYKCPPAAPGCFLLLLNHALRCFPHPLCTTHRHRCSSSLCVCAPFQHCNTPPHHEFSLALWVVLCCSALPLGSRSQRSREPEASGGCCCCRQSSGGGGGAAAMWEPGDHKLTPCRPRGLPVGQT